MTATLDASLREIVTEDIRAAAVFERFGIDFCCGGRLTLGEACGERHVNALDVLIQINEACGRQDLTTPRFANWSVDALIAHIVRYHHAYVRRVLPSLVAHIERLATAHGQEHPELFDICEIFEIVADEMTTHMNREEGVLFPWIEELVTAVRAGTPQPAPPFDSGKHPMEMMEHEHQCEAHAMARIRELTGGYTPPADACTSHAVCFRELEAFERDLHLHVHVENNVLYPKVGELLARCRQQSS